MGRDAEAEEQLLRRRRRLFSGEERSFRLDRRSPAAAALHDAVADVLPRFLGSYNDDTLAEYIVILVCNGKHQYQARDDLEAFLADDTEKFVSWLWGYLSKRDFAPADNSSVQHGLANEIRSLNDKKNLLAAEPEHSRIVKSNTLLPQEHHGLRKLDSTKEQNGSRRHISSTVIVTPERLVSEQWYGEGQHQKKVQSAPSGKSFSTPNSGVAARRTAQALTRDEFLHEEHIGRNVSARRFPLTVGSDDGDAPDPMKRRGNVWDRLGKPAIENSPLARETDYVHVQNGVHKKAKLMVDEYEQRCRVNSSTEGYLFDKADSRRFSKSYTDLNTVRTQEHAERSNRSRLIGRLNFGNVERNHLQVRDVSWQKSSPPLPVKGVQLQSPSEFTSGVKSSPTVVSETTCHVSKSSQGDVSASNKLSQVAMQRNVETEVLHSQQVSSPSQSKTGSSAREDGGSNKPVKDEMLDMKLKLKQMELDVLKLRSKQAQINNVKQGAQSSAPHADSEEDADSRTVLVTNVHFAATKEALSMHFLKCGTVLKTNILTDAITGYSKGVAFVTFADKGSVEKAVPLSGSSFFSRVLTVMRKVEAPPGFLASLQQTGRPLQPWNSPPFQKGVNAMQSPSFHLQWKREQSVLEKSPASCPY